jgi:hypothetical protein
MEYPEADVKAKAYELWQGRGMRHGHDRDDWYAAELILELEPAWGRRLRPPEFHSIEPAEILRQVQISHAGLHEFFTPAHSWIETTAGLETIFEFDRNRRLHFEEGFLNACYRVVRDPSITAIAKASHFPYRDLPAVRKKVRQFAELYKSRAHLPPPLFFYPAPHQLEVLDGVHRLIAALEATRNCEPCWLTIWLGFNHRVFHGGQVVQQMWTCAMRRLRQAQEGR